MLKAGCSIERFLAPVEPGNLLLLGYKDEIPVVSAPGFFRSAKANVVDLIPPSMLARYRISGWEIASLGRAAGVQLKEIAPPLATRAHPARKWIAIAGARLFLRQRRCIVLLG